MGKHAIVFGASGIQGWAFVNELLCGEDTNEFSNITALTNRALPPEYTLWPESSRLRLVPGLDLVNNSREELEDQFKKKVPDVESITHVYFCGKYEPPARVKLTRITQHTSGSRIKPKKSGLILEC